MPEPENTQNNTNNEATDQAIQNAVLKIHGDFIKPAAAYNAHLVLENNNHDLLIVRNGEQIAGDHFFRLRGLYDTITKVIYFEVKTIPVKPGEKIRRIVDEDWHLDKTPENISEILKYFEIFNPQETDEIELLRQQHRLNSSIRTTKRLTYGERAGVKNNAHFKQATDQLIQAVTSIISPYDYHLVRIYEEFLVEPRENAGRKPIPGDRRIMLKLYWEDRLRDEIEYRVSYQLYSKEENGRWRPPYDYETTSFTPNIIIPFDRKSFELCLKDFKEKFASCLNESPPRSRISTYTEEQTSGETSARLSEPAVVEQRTETSANNPDPDNSKTSLIPFKTALAVIFGLALLGLAKCNGAFGAEMSQPHSNDNHDNQKTELTFER